MDVDEHGQAPFYHFVVSESDPVPEGTHPLAKTDVKY